MSALQAGGRCPVCPRPTAAQACPGPPQLPRRARVPASDAPGSRPADGAERDHVRGAVTAPTTVVEYGDYECPYCGAAHRIVQEVRRRMGKGLCFVYRPFPLTNVHPHAELAAEAAEAAGAQGRFWEM